MREQKAIAAFAEVWLWRDLIDVMRRYRERWWRGSGRWTELEQLHRRMHRLSKLETEQRAAAESM